MVVVEVAMGVAVDVEVKIASRPWHFEQSDKLGANKRKAFSEFNRWRVEARKNVHTYVNGDDPSR